MITWKEEHSMLILIDKKIPEAAKEELSHYGDLLELETSGITYDSISGHPDIFFFQSGSKLITAPNLPETFIAPLKSYGLQFGKGKCSVGQKYPGTARYNAAVGENIFIHNLKITDDQVLECVSGKYQVEVQQGYCRCNLLPLRNDSFITSDKGIYTTLTRENISALYADPSEIILPGFSHGFFGGACGVYENKVFITGSLDYLKDGSEVKAFLHKLDYNIIELYDGPLFDGGSILFLK